MHTRGVVWTLPTPFRAGAEVDHEGLARLVDLAVRAGVSAVSVLGAAGEASRLTERERLEIVDTVTRHANGRLAIVVDTSSDGPRTCIDFSRQVRGLGAAAVLVSPPRAHRLSNEWIVHHYRSLAEAVDLPIVVQDAPAQCGVSMDAGLLVRIGREVPAARTLRIDAAPTSMKITRILAAAAETRLHVLGGQGGLFLIEDLRAGADGVSSGFACPELLVRVVALVRDGHESEAVTLFHRFVPLMRFENVEGVGPAVRKEMLRRRGVLVDASTRAPGIVLDEGMRGAIEQLMAWAARQEGAEWLLD